MSTFFNSVNPITLSQLGFNIGLKDEHMPRSVKVVSERVLCFSGHDYFGGLEFRHAKCFAVVNH
jgi:hypothetical protein